MTQIYELADLVAGGRDFAAPFVLRARLRLAESEASEVDAELHCEAVLRHLPGRRLVVRARYQGALHAVKFFFGRDARRYYLRETEGWAALRGSGVPVPELTANFMLSGHTMEPGYGVATQWLPDAQAVSEEDEPALLQVVGGLGRLHAHSALRTDPHLRNYLRTSDGTVYAIDGGGVRPHVSMGEARARNNLARMLAELPPAVDGIIPGACNAYSQARWQRDAGPKLVTDVRRRLGRQRNLRTRRYLHKTLRECSEFHCERGTSRFLACARPAWGQGVQAFAADPESVFHQAQIVKAGNSATVVRAQIGGHTLVVKRYNVKSRWHGVRRALRWTPRYRLSWYNGHRMDFLRLPTARPVALLEVRESLLRTVAYLVMEDCGDRDLESIVRDEGVSALLVEQVVAVFLGLRSAGLVHGDTKASNFLQLADAMYLVDLDAMRPGRDLAKDVRRFLANWEHLPEVRARFADALQAAGMPL